MGQQEIENLNNWHLSKYNIFSTEETENKKLPCINLFKGTYSELDLEDIKKLYHLKEINDIEKELSGFIKQGIIVNFDELTLLQSKLLISFVGRGTLNITLVTTMKCNFNCPYCFETHDGVKMSLEIQDKVFELIKHALMASGSKNLYITWYGGEPLLAIDVIENLSKKIIDYTKEKNINYNSGIITNGYLLNQEKINILENNNVSNIQITLDGLEENHNKTRCLIDGTSTFNKIIDNLYNIKFKGRINIRNNIHENNFQDSKKLQEIILDIKNKTHNDINYYQAVIVNNPAEERKNQVNFLNEDLISKIEAEKYSKDFLCGKVSFCGAQKLWSIVIGSDGYLYKCWEDVWDKNRSFGKVDNWNPYNAIYSSKNLNSLLKYINSIPLLNDEECKQCAWLPLCAGGCPSKKIYHNIKCISFKNNPNYFIKKVKKYTIEKMTSVK